MTELKPCPFCGAEMKCVQEKKCVQDEWGIIIGCEWNCEWKIDGMHSNACYLKLRYGVNYPTKESAINAWNRRVNE